MLELLAPAGSPEAVRAQCVPARTQSILDMDDSMPAATPKIFLMMSSRRRCLIVMPGGEGVSDPQHLGIRPGAAPGGGGRVSAPS